MRMVMQALGLLFAGNAFVGKPNGYISLCDHQSSILFRSIFGQNSICKLRLLMAEVSHIPQVMQTSTFHDTDDVP